MDWRRRTRRWLLATAAVLSVPAVPVAGSFFMIARGLPVPVLPQYGDSMPKGIYILDPFAEPAVGAVVVLYEAPRWGWPMLMKRVRAADGDVFCWDEDAGRHRINGAPMPRPVAKAAAKGVEPWKGCTRLGPDELVGYGDHPVRSYDSRYFGPFDRGAVIGVYHLVLAAS